MAFIYLFRMRPRPQHLYSRRPIAFCFYKRRRVYIRLNTNRAFSAGRFTLTLSRRVSAVAVTRLSCAPFSPFVFTNLRRCWTFLVRRRCTSGTHRILRVLRVTHDFCTRIFHSHFLPFFFYTLSDTVSSFFFFFVPRWIRSICTLDIVDTVVMSVEVNDKARPRLQVHNCVVQPLLTGKKFVNALAYRVIMFTRPCAKKIY